MCISQVLKSRIGQGVIEWMFLSHLDDGEVSDAEFPQPVHPWSLIVSALGQQIETLNWRNIRDVLTMLFGRSFEDTQPTVMSPAEAIERALVTRWCRCSMWAGSPWMRWSPSGGSAPGIMWSPVMPVWVSGKSRDVAVDIWKSGIYFHVRVSGTLYSSCVCLRQLYNTCRRQSIIQYCFLLHNQLISFDYLIAFSARRNRCLTRIHGGDHGNWPHFSSFAY